MDLRLPQPGFWMAALLVGIVLLIQVALSIPLGVIDVIVQEVLHRPPPGLVQHPLVVGVVNLLACGAAIGLGLYWNRLRLREAFPLRSISLLQVAGVILTGAGMFVLLSDLDNAFRAVFPPPKWLAALMEKLFFPADKPVSQFFLLVIVAPLTEELLFRGIILRGLLGRFRPAMAVLLTSILFAALHLNPWQSLSALLLGCVIGWFYLRTGTVWVCVLAHALNNGLAWALSLIPVHVPGLAIPSEPGQVTFQPWWLDASGVALLAAGILIFVRATPGAHLSAAPKPPVIAEAQDSTFQAADPK